MTRQHFIHETNRLILETIACLSAYRDISADKLPDADDWLRKAEYNFSALLQLNRRYAHPTSKSSPSPVRRERAGVRAHL